MEKILANLRKTLPKVSFEPGDAFFWSPEYSKVSYKLASEDKPEHGWALLHEASHALLGHKNYQHDIELLLLEVEAWQQAKKLAGQFGLEISEDHIQDCLDTYRDWLHQRATCPRCSNVSIQVSSREYRCHNCTATWSVSASRFCRPYRLSNATNKKSPKTVSQATFQ
ncbi:MAG: hypothetical protein ACRD4B_00105 [Acidobacteriota bacterium]